MKTAMIAAVIAAVLGGLGLATVDPPSNLVEGGLPAVEPAAQMPEEIVAEPVAEGEPEPVAESEPDAAWDGEWESYGYEPVEEYIEPYEAIESAGGEAPDLKTMGVVSDGENEWTWYSSRVLPGNGLTELNANGRTTDDRGFVVDGEGYIAVASPDEGIPVGTEVDTPWGPAKVYDYNPGDSWDVYTCWE